MPLPLTFPVEKNVPCPTYQSFIKTRFIETWAFADSIMQSWGRETQAQKRFFKPLITLPKELSLISFGPYLPAISLHFVSLIFRLSYDLLVS
jgi:hypothetical protein